MLDSAHSRVSALFRPSQAFAAVLLLVSLFGSREAGAVCPPFPTGVSLGPGYTMNLDGSGGMVSLTLVVDAACGTWTATSGAGWMTIVSATSGVGDANILVSVDVNTGSPRSDYIYVSIPGWGGTISQFIMQATCTTVLTPTSVNVGYAGVTGLSLNASYGQFCPFSGFVSNDAWITITGGSGVSGSMNVDYDVAPNPGPARVGSITANGQTHTVNQADGCAANTALVPPSANQPFSGASGQTFQVQVAGGCPWTAVSNNAWITVTGGASGNGTANVTYDVAANVGPARVGTVTAGGQTFTVNQADGCAANTALVPPNANPPSSGATGQTFQVQVAGGCPWTAVSNDAWITVTGGASGNGTANITYDVAANVGPARVGTITAGGQTFTVNQASGCAANTTLVPPSANPPFSGATGQTFQVQVAGGCPWTAVSNDAWITVTGGASGNGTANVTYDVAANVGPARVGTVTAGGQTFTVNQADGCAANTALVPPNANPPSSGATGQTFQVQVAGGCPWTAVSNDAWITVTGGASGNGTANITYDVAANVGPARVGTVTAGGQTFTVIQADGCAANTTLVPPSANPPFSGATGQTFQVQVASGCPWTAVSNDAWVTVTAGASGNGTANVTYDVAANVGPARVGTVTAGGQTFTVNQASGCAANTALVPTNASQPFSGASGQTFQVQVAGGCPWTAVSNDAWITVTAGASGNGTANVTYDVAANVGPARVGTVTAGGQTFTVNQASGCAANTALVPTNASQPFSGASGQTFQVQVAGGCPWTAVSNDAWITVTAGASGNGTANVTYDVAANVGPARVGTVTAGGQTFTVNQASGCAANTTLVPTNTSQPFSGATGQTFQVQVAGGCPWTAVSNDAWITVTAGASGNGTANVTYDVAANVGSARVGTITAGGQTFTVNQASGCAANTTLVPTNASQPFSGAIGQTFQVQVAGGCPWTAVSNAPWITITAGASGNGTAIVTYDVAANVGSARVGTITAGGQTFTVNQASGCAANTTLVPTNASLPFSGATGQTFQVQVAGGCPWTAVSNAPWITITAGASGNGTAIVTYDVAANVGSARVGTITAGGQTFTVNQTSGCAANTTLVPTNASQPFSGATGQTFQVQIAGGCPWTAISNAPWITITAGASGNGTAIVTYDVAANLSPARVGTITAGGQTFTVNQASGCAANTTLVPTNASQPFSGATGQTFQVQVAGGCPWTAVSNDAWVTVTAGASGNGTASVTYGVAANVGPARVGTITAGGQTFTVNQTSGCAASTTLVPTNASQPFSGATSQTFQIQVAGGCPWTAVSNAPWITITAGASGNGTASVSYDVTANVGPARVGTITAGGQTFTVDQADGCTANTIVIPTGASQPFSGATGQTFQVQVTGGCPWTAVSNDAWITITAGSSGNGTASVTYDVAANVGPARVGTVTAGGQTFTLDQADGCTANTILIPTGASQPFSGAIGQTFQVQVAGGCPWTAVSNDAWIIITAGASGSGTGIVVFDVMPNSGPPRDGSIAVAGLTFAINQAEGCAVNTSLSPASATVAASGASGRSLGVLAPQGCPWAASSNDGWISLVSGTAGTGPGTVVYDVGANPGPARTGGITVAGQTFTVNQEEGCSGSTTLTPQSTSIAAAGEAGLTFQVGAAPGCSWTASSNAPWITVTAGSGTGQGNVILNVAANPGPVRIGTVIVSGQTFTVTQDDGCLAFTSLDPPRADIPAEGTPVQTFQVQTSAGCVWTAISSEPWIMISGGGSGTGTATVTYSVAPNAGGARTGTISAAGKIFTIDQVDGCSANITLEPGSTTVAAAGAAELSLQVQAGPGCSWTAATDQSWINITTGQAGTGTGTVTYSVAQNPGPSRSGTITAGGHAFNVSQLDGCSSHTNVAPASASFPASGASSQTFQVLTEAGCAWSAISNTEWITVISGGSGSQAGTVTYNIAANPGPQRTGTVSVRGAVFTVNQEGGCAGSTSLLPQNADLPSEGGSALSFQIQTGAGCSWTASPGSTWITVLPEASGTGPGTVRYSVTANTGPARTGTISAGEATFTIYQAGPCSAPITLSPQSEDLPFEAATGLSFEVQTAPGCTWTARSNASWIIIDNGSSGSGSGAVTYSVVANSGPPRTGTITAGGEIFTVTQANGCSAGTTLNPGGASLDAEGAVGRSFGLSSQTGCTWTAASDVGWITVTSGATGSGSGAVTYNVAANNGPARNGTITAGGRAFSVQQADGCAANTSLQPTSASVAASGATGQTFEVRIGAGCPWTAASSAAWITISGNPTGSGTGVVTFDIAANPGPSRTGTISAAGRTFTVNQADLCASSTTLSPTAASFPAEGASNQTIQVQAPAGCPWAATSSTPWITITSGAGTGNGAVTYNVAPNAAEARTGSVVVAGRTLLVAQALWCGTPSTPRFATFPTAPVIAGSSFTLTWEPSTGLPPSGTYQVSVGKSADCASPATITTADLFVTIPTEESETVTYCARVRAVAGTDCAPGEYVSDFSSPVTIVVRPLPPAFTVIQGLTPVPTAERDSAPPTGSTVVFRNVGDSAGTLSLATEGSFFSVSPATLTGIPPGSDASVAVVFRPESTATSGIQSGTLTGTWSTGDGARSISTAITLTVLEGRSESTAGIRLEPIGSSLVYFRQYRGNPAPQQIIVRNSGSLPVRIAPSIGPGGTWLSIVGEFASPLQPYTERYFDLIVDRGRRTTEDGPPPLSTSLRIENVDGNAEDAAIFTVFDEEPEPAVSGTNRPEEEASLILGTTVSTTPSSPPAARRRLTSAPASKQYFSDGWVRNRGSDAVTVDLYYTPEGAEGLRDSRVKKTTITVQGYSSFRLSDFLKGLFDVTGSGHVEIRSTRLSQLSVRSSVESIGFKNDVPTGYGSDLPVLLAGQGVGITSAGSSIKALITGLRGPLASHRTNVVLSETSGAPLQVRLRLFDGSGLLLGQKLVAVMAYSKTQVNSGDPDLFPVPYSTGSISIEPLSGSGTVSALASVIDNSSQSYALKLATVISPPPPAGRALNAVSSAFLPAVVQEKTADSFYTTRVSITSGASTAKTIRLSYIPDRGLGDPSEPVAVIIPGRDGSNPDAGPPAVVFDQVLKDLLEIESGARGMLKVEGELGDLTFTSETSTPLDLDDPSAGRSLSSLNPAPGADPKFAGVFSKDSQEIVGIKQSDSDTVKSEVSFPAIEENAQFRTNLILAEMGGEKGKVRVLLRKPGGAALGEPAVIDLGANEQIRIERVIPAIAKPPGGAAEFKDIEIVVQPVDGKARTLALISRIANDPKSKRIDTYVLGPAVSGSAKKGKK